MIHVIYATFVLVVVFFAAKRILPHNAAAAVIFVAICGWAIALYEAVGGMTR